VDLTRIPAVGIVFLLTGLLLMSGCQPNDPLREARERMARGDVVGSIEVLRELLDEGGDDPEVLFLYGQALTLSGQPALAEWPLRKAMEDPDWFERAGTAVAMSEMAGGNFDNAADVLAEIIEKNPENMDARLLRASSYAKSPRHLELALEAVEEIFEIDPDEIRAYEPQILAYLSLNDEEGATAAFEELGVKIEEGDVDEETAGWYCATMAIFANDNGDEELARERWADCNERFPTHENVITTSTTFFDSKGEHEHSLEIVRAAFDADPTGMSGYREVVAKYLRSLNRWDEAEALLQEAANSENATQAMRGNLALAEQYEAAGDFTKAANSLEAGTRIYESAYGPSPELQFSLADLLIRAERDDRALEIAEKMTVPAQKAMVQARVAHRRGDYANALARYKESARLWPDNPYAPYHGGHAALQLGRFDDALSLFRSSIRISQDATDAPRLAARLSAAHGQWQGAADVLGQIPKALAPEASLYWIEVVGHLRGPQGAAIVIQKQLVEHPALTGEAIAAGAKGVGEHFGPEPAWELVQPAVGAALPLDDQLAILQSAVRWAPGEAELASLESRIGELLEQHPENPVLRTIEGTYLVRKDDFAAAMERFRAALTLDPGHSEAALRLAVLIGRENPDEALELIDGALTEPAPGARTPFDSALFLAAISQVEESDAVIRLLERALERDPIDAGLTLRLAKSLERRGDAKERVQSLARRLAWLNPAAPLPPSDAPTKDPEAEAKPVGPAG
jgi:tetratricopeptide (TPR) repeat protein